MVRGVEEECYGTRRGSARGEVVCTVAAAGVGCNQGQGGVFRLAVGRIVVWSAGRPLKQREGQAVPFLQAQGAVSFFGFLSHFRHAVNRLLYCTQKQIQTDNKRIQVS